MSFIPIENYNADLLKGSTLLLPTVSIGNVPQLTFDLLIHSLKLERVGYIDQDTLMPVSGVLENNNTGVTVPIEVFQSNDQKWTCIQQRSPTIKGKRQAFLDQITAFATQFSQVVILTSMDASRRLDSQISGPPFRVYGEGELTIRAVTLGVPVLENMELEESQEGEKSLDLPGAGLAKQLYDQLSSQVQTTLFIMFALEGDNVQDSIEYASLINTLLKIDLSLTRWIPPKSWELLFGTPFNAELYQ
ncbi:PAC2 family-domain-containing protein [Gilbertella persicaria]|uniref:PAC2 family-domain-containing protein n=1 Tax=Gilbertella persicaria TaxID=101096 RepID=UPI00221F0D9E|nr:PAC2 family-domain-containing protein [Gilbertella persicaria]KAI8079586.1 PAC2 family-domain-containing protein [Gilbertella persicaria]